MVLIKKAHFAPFFDVETFIFLLNCDIIDVTIRFARIHGGFI